MAYPLISGNTVNSSPPTAPAPPPVVIAQQQQHQQQHRELFAPPEGYVVPPWPGLYSPLRSSEAEYLYYTTDILWYTTVWCLILFTVVYGIAGLWGYLVLVRRRPHLAWILPVVFAIVAGMVALTSGIAFGYALGLLYNAGQFKMSTWIPLLWALLQVLITLSGAYSPMSTYL